LTCKSQDSKGQVELFPKGARLIKGMVGGSSPSMSTKIIMCQGSEENN